MRHFSKEATCDAGPFLHVSLRNTVGCLTLRIQLLPWQQQTL